MIDRIPRGTVIQVGNLKRTVQRTMYCWIDEGYADIEFTDPNDQYGHYKSSYDKGKIFFPNGTVFDYSNTK